MDLDQAINTEDEYEPALSEIERLFNSPVGSQEGEILDRLVNLVLAYEDKHYPIGGLHRE